jgi:hypothetical protein
LLKIEDIKTPTTIEEFRDNLKKYCLGYKESVFIYNKKNRKKFSININKISKISDVFKFIKDNNVLGISDREFDVVLMCDISNINAKDLMMNEKDAIRSLKEVYLFNNQDKEERSNFLNSTPSAIEKIVSGEKIINKIDAKVHQTSMDYQILRDLYVHLFGEYFDTVTGLKKKYNLSKYN